AAVPWACSLGISSLSGRPILVERYLCFAQFGLLGLWGTAWFCLPGVLSRLLLAWMLGAPLCSGLVSALSRIPEQPPAIQEAAEFLRDQYRTGDVVLTEHAGALN